MTVKELKEHLNKFPDEMLVKWINHDVETVDYQLEQIYVTSDTAFIDEEAPEEEWDYEDGKLVMGDGEKYIIMNAEVY